MVHLSGLIFDGKRQKMEINAGFDCGIDLWLHSGSIDEKEK